MTLKDLFISIMTGKSVDLHGVDSSTQSRRELMGYVSDTYSGQVENFTILNFEDAFLDELLSGEDMTFKVSAALSKIDRAIPHLRLKAYV